MFRASDPQAIDMCFKELMRKSQNIALGPSLHFRIPYDSLASHGEGAGSNSIVITSLPPPLENNNSGSSSGNGHVCRPPPLTDHPPSPHSYHHNMSTSSNGSVPHLQHRIQQPARHQEFEQRGTTVAMVHDPFKGTGEPPTTVIKRSVPVPSSLPYQRHSSKDFSSDPVGNNSPLLKTVTEKFSLGGTDNPAFFLEEEMPKFAVGDEVNLPLPPPCTANSQTHAEFTSAQPPPTVCGLSPDSSSKQSSRHKNRFLRSHSYMNINHDSILILNHCDINMVQELSSKGSVHDDSVYYRFYYNIGFIKAVYSRMSKKIKRRSRLSKELKEGVDFSKLDHHEQWYDRDYKIRDQDTKFCR